MFSRRVHDISTSSYPYVSIREINIFHRRGILAAIRQLTTDLGVSVRRKVEYAD